MRCPACGTWNPPVADFCSGCGASMGSGAYRQPGWATGSVAPRLLGDLLGDTFRVYGSRFEVFFLIALVPQIPTFIGTLISMPAAFSIILSLVGLVIGVVATGATAFAVAGQYLQRPMSVGDCYGRAWGRVVSLVGSSIVFFIALAISVLLVVIVIGIPLFFYVLVRWFFYAPAVILEGKKGPLESLRRSRELVRGSWWRVFGIGIVLCDYAVNHRRCGYYPGIHRHRFQPHRRRSSWHHRRDHSYADRLYRNYSGLFRPADQERRVQNGDLGLGSGRLSARMAMPESESNRAGQRFHGREHAAVSTPPAFRLHVRGYRSQRPRWSMV